MGMQNISEQDKQNVIDSLAQGESYAQALDKTAIKSKDTIHRIAHNEANAIEQKRQQYLKKIKKFGASDNRRALSWATMLHATKRVGKDLIEIPDWQARATALKYIDALAGFDKTNEVKLEVKDTTPPKQYDLDSPEVVDFNKKFREFIMQRDRA